MTAPDRGGRLEEDDHDLLTFGEGGARLNSGMAQMRQRIAALESGEGSESELATARKRLRALEEAVARNSAPAIGDTNFDTFFGYGGTACRNFTTAHD